MANQPDDIPSDLFLRNPNLGNQFPRINCDQSDAEIKKRLKKWSTFPLEDGRVYIYIWGKPSVNFCMIKLHKIGISFYLVRVAFLLGVSMDERLKYFEDIKQHIFAQKPPISPKISSPESGEVSNDLTPQIIRKPIEKIMVRYRMYPKLMISPLNSTKLFTHQQADQQTYNWQVLRSVFKLILPALPLIG